MSQVIRNVLARRNMELVRSSTLNRFLAARAVDLVVDVGANTGQFARALRKRGYGGRILSFEPVAACFREVSKRAAIDPLWETFNFALGAAEGKTSIHVSENPVFSSIKTMTSEAVKFDGNSKSLTEEVIDVKTLDSVLVNATSKNIFLKIDTQGFEQEVLAGGAETLKKCVGLLMELPIVHLYNGVWSFSEALAFADSRGFVPAQIRPTNLSHDDETSAIEFDCVFRRKDSPLH